MSHLSMTVIADHEVTERDPGSNSIDVELALCLRFLSDINNSYDSKLACLRTVIDVRKRHPTIRVGSQRDVCSGILDLCLRTTAASIAQSNDDSSRIGQSADLITLLCGLLPTLLLDLETSRSQGNAQSPGADALCLAFAIEHLFESSAPFLEQCDEFYRRKHLQGSAQSSQPTEEGKTGESKRPVSVSMAQWVVQSGNAREGDYPSLCDRVRISSFDEIPPISLSLQAAAESTSLRSLVEQKILSDNLDCVTLLCEEYVVQNTVSSAILQVFGQLSDGENVESLARLSTTLLESHSSAIRTLLLYVDPSTLLRPLSLILDNASLLGSIEDSSIFGPIILLSQHIVKHGLQAGASIEALLPRHRSPFLATYFRSMTAVPTVQAFDVQSDEDFISNWITALFGSEGIPDDLTRSSPPQVLLRITPAIYSQIVQALTIGAIDLDTVKSGLTYFLQDLLIFTLPGAVHCLLDTFDRMSIVVTGRYSVSEVDLAERRRAFCIDLLAELLTSTSCPSSVKDLVAHRVRSTLLYASPISPAALTLTNLLSSCGTQFSSEALIDLDCLVALIEASKLTMSLAPLRSTLALYDCVSVRRPFDLQSMSTGIIKPDTSDEHSKQIFAPLLVAVILGCRRQISDSGQAWTKRSSLHFALKSVAYLDGLLATAGESTRYELESLLCEMLVSSKDIESSSSRESESSMNEGENFAFKKDWEANDTLRMICEIISHLSSARRAIAPKRE